MASSEQPTTNNQQPTTDNQQPTTNNKQPQATTSNNNQRPPTTTNHNQPQPTATNNDDDDHHHQPAFLMLRSFNVMFSFARPADMLIKETRGQNHKNKTCQTIFSKRQARNRKATTPQHIYHFTLFGSSQPIIPQQGPPPMRTLHHLAFVGKYPRNADRLCKISTANTNIETLKRSNHAVLEGMS